MTTVTDLEKEIDDLRRILKRKEAQLLDLKTGKQPCSDGSSSSNNDLKRDEIVRYSRQMLIPNIGKTGQCKLKNSSVLIVGVGGLGCPVAQYLVGAGVGHIGLVDYDDVELTNLHRQLLHTQDWIGLHKVSSARHNLLRQNSNIKIEEHHLQLDSSNALQLVERYDVVVDATDNVATRYLLNDACVMKKKPLISGSALRMEGQLTVYNYDGGPCYRCLFPQPPPPETVTSCGDGGVLGVVPGTIGLLQALETIKILLSMPGVLKQRLLLFDAESTIFRTITLRTAQPDCAVCGEAPQVTKLIDYEQFCGAKATDKDSGIHWLKPHQRITPEELVDLLSKDETSVVVDVRSREEFSMCSLPKTLNFPLTELNSGNESVRMKAFSELKQRICDLTSVEKATGDQQKTIPVVTLCRRGNDSQRAVRLLESELADAPIKLLDVKGGLHAWARSVDESFPVY